jgi:hypothetical protein
MITIGNQRPKAKNAKLRIQGFPAKTMAALGHLSRIGKLSGMAADLEAPLPTPRSHTFRSTTMVFESRVHPITLSLLIWRWRACNSDIMPLLSFMFLTSIPFQNHSAAQLTSTPTFLPHLLDSISTHLTHYKLSQSLAISLQDGF